MTKDEPVNILLVDDTPGKLLSYEVILQELGENLIKVSSAKAALAELLKTEVAVILTDVCMPDLDGFEFAAMLRQHPRYERTAVIFISAVHLSDYDYVRGYNCGAVDYVSVPVVPEILRAKVKIFVELFRKTKQLETPQRRARKSCLATNNGARGVLVSARREREAAQACKPGGGIRRPMSTTSSRTACIGRRSSSPSRTPAVPAPESLEFVPRDRPCRRPARRAHLHAGHARKCGEAPRHRVSCRTQRRQGALDPGSRAGSP